jgi:thiosulfate dehydrogenase [quinone] large subunit
MRTPSSSYVGWALLPLRLFLGVTFCFAGLQKLANPAFFRASDPASIQAQLHAYSTTSPVKPLLSLASHTPVLVGVLIALGELAVGTGTLLGLWARVAAAGGMALSIILFLSVSFHSRPYYTGADIVFVFAWTPLLLAGAGGVWSLDQALARGRAAPGGPEARARPVRARTTTGQGSPEPVSTDPASAASGTRRAFLGKTGATGVAAVLGMVTAGLAAGFGRLVGGTATVTASGPSSPTTTAKPGTTTTTDLAAGTTTTTHPAGQVIGQTSQVAVGQALRFTDQRTGDPAYVVQPQSGTFLAFDAICPHAGCEVGFYPSSDQFVCPCHGSRFSGQNGSVLNGPATRGLTSIPVTVGQGGSLTVP